MKDSTKYAILGLLAVGLIINGVYLFSKKNYSGSSGKSSIISQNATASSDNSTAVANNTNQANANTSLDAQNQAAAATPAEGTSAALPKTSLTWSEKEYDFGNIKQDSENTHIFTFTNTGSEPLIIEKAKGSCGCTVPEYPKEPIPPGASDEIKVVYKPGKQKNKQTKKVTVTANTDPVQTILTITADVEVPEGTE
ncbi:MAG: DUF1573 domain-containing protein [Flavobacteriales bacterium]|nr:DUF1573 domain-containing protein [Flavobacteriales bacterium]